MLSVSLSSPTPFYVAHRSRPALRSERTRTLSSQRVTHSLARSLAKARRKQTREGQVSIKSALRGTEDVGDQQTITAPVLPKHRGIMEGGGMEGGDGKFRFVASALSFLRQSSHL